MCKILFIQRNSTTQEMMVFHPTYVSYSAYEIIESSYTIILFLYTSLTKLRRYIYLRSKY